MRVEISYKRGEGGAVFQLKKLENLPKPCQNEIPHFFSKNPKPRTKKEEKKIDTHFVEEKPTVGEEKGREKLEKNLGENPREGSDFSREIKRKSL